MDNRQGTLHSLGVKLFRRLTGIYPERFRRQYAGEIYGVLLDRLEEVSAAGQPGVPVFLFQETGALLVSIIREHWHEQRGRHERRGQKEGSMLGDERIYAKLRRTVLKRSLLSAARVILIVAALIVLYYAGIYTYARIKIAQGRQLGVYATLEEAVYSSLGTEGKGARVIRVDLNHAEPCFPDGKLPFYWCVTSTNFYDREPEGSRHTSHRGYTGYYHLPDGWVFIPEVISGFTGQVMERFGLEGAGK